MKKGFMLIELSITIFIFIIIISVSFVSINQYKRYINEMNYKQSIFEIEDFLSMTKARAINRNKPQRIELRNEHESYLLMLEEEGEIIDCLSLGKTWDCVKVNISNIDVNNSGFIKPCTIKMIKGNDKYRITIQAGGDLISEYKD